MGESIIDDRHGMLQFALPMALACAGGATDVASIQKGFGVTSSLLVAIDREGFRVFTGSMSPDESAAPQQSAKRLHLARAPIAAAIARIGVPRRIRIPRTEKSSLPAISARFSRAR